MPGVEAPGVIFAYPISDAELRLHDLVCDRINEFDESGGEVLWWRPIGPPSVAGPIYMELRTPELEERDRLDTELYHRRCEDGGGERRYLQGQHRALAKKFAIPDDVRPAIVFTVANSPEARIVLPIAPAALEDMKRRRDLACFLDQELQEGRIRSFPGLDHAEPSGLREFENHLAAMEKVIAGEIAHGRGVPKRMWHSYCRSRGLIETVDPKNSTIGEAVLTKSGVLKFRTFTNGKQDGEVAFAGLNQDVCRQRQLMLMLLNAWRDGAHLQALVEAVYDVDLRTFHDDEFTVSRYGKRLAQLIRDIRDKKFEKAGINPDVLPKLHSPHVKNGMMSLRLAKLTLHGFGGDDREMRTAARSGRRSSL